MVGYVVWDESGVTGGGKDVFFVGTCLDKLEI
jgi:hypothetical protein